MSDLVIIGSGGHAGVLASIARRDGLGPLAGYVDPVDRGRWFDLAYLGGDEAAAGRRVLLGVGMVANAAPRWSLVERLRAGGSSLVELVSRRASVATEACLGVGTVVLDLAAVNAGAELGTACIVNTGAIVEHDCRLGDNVHVAPGATLCGEVAVGAHTLVGAGVTVLPGVTIAGGCVIGAGSVVTGDLERPGTYVGAPAVWCDEGMDR